MNILGIIVSFIFIFLIIGVSTFLTNKKILSGEGSRKFIHIGVANWWIIAMIFFDSPLWAAVVPALFIIINYISYKKQIFKAMERGGEKSDLGTVYYAISLFVLSIVTFWEGMNPYVGAMGILIMGYGDGFAAVIGKKYGKHKFEVMGGQKSLEGATVMFVVSFVVAFIIAQLAGGSSLILPLSLAMIATLVELFSPYGTDNLTVPFITSLSYYFLWFNF
ncbi:diacylglycerol/polyprenol kinase family protein [Geotoga petraea]|uniref:Phosphatidate cytidylyltransferase n=1 Tax=Geotoga petraea TaxID=28234 RepID=A0A4Z0W311_9BACT|nr:phosphatidate cytidylyltransferase [Geotoga petraea]TGG88889.1 phosphatidate cytidylyltransferase [Geotoga petraea]